MRIIIPDRKKLVYETRMPMRWGDMDAMRHLNNAMYFRYMETARVDWFTSLGCLADGSEQGPVIVNAFCNFYEQLRYPGEVVLRMFVSDPGRATFETWTQMARGDAPERVCAEGGATTMWVDFTRNRSADLPDWLRRAVAD